jgi:AsmA protein
VKKLLIGVLAAIAVLLIAALAAPLLVPADFVKGRVAALIEQKTGRELRIAGPISFSLLPSLALVAHDVTLSSPPGGFSGNLLQVETVDLSLKALPLLHGAIEIDHLRLEQPAINFEIDKGGGRNWIFHRAAKPSATATPASSAGSFSLTAGNVTIVGGKTSYLDQRNGKKRIATDLTMTLSLPSPAGPLEAAGTAMWNGDVVRLALTLASPDALQDGSASAATIAFSAVRGTIDFHGEIGGKGPQKATGAIAVKLPSARDFLAWAQVPLAAHGSGLGPLSIDGKIAVAGGKLNLTDATIALDAIAAKGTLTVARGSERPALSGHLDIDRLDLNPYAAAKGEPPPHGTSSAGAATPAATPPPAAAPQSPVAPPPPPSPRWSDAAFDLAPLKIVDADLDVTANAIRLRAIDIGKSTLGLHLKDGRLELDLKEMALYRGKGTGEIVADGGGPAPAFAANLVLTGITVERFPLNIAGLDQLSGTGDVSLLLNARGGDMREIVGSLYGGGRLNFADGTIGSAGLGPLMKNSIGPAANEAAIPREIDYRSLSGSAMIERGILRNSDLKLVSPKLTATGAGALDLPARTIDYLWQPNIAGLGSARIAITGAWDAPAYKALSVSITKGMREPIRKPRSR